MDKFKAPPSWHFGGAIFLSSFLLFAIQPIQAKHILPWFGGTSTVWTTCMLVYQTLLLLGYLYAYVSGKLPLKKQCILHILILTSCFILLITRMYSWETPITPGIQWKPEGSDMPVWRIGAILLACIGLPFFLLASTSTILQSWLSRIYPVRTPYSFYVISNIGSFAGLVSYPIIIEPFSTLRMQSIIWSGSYAAFVILYAYIAIKLYYLHSSGSFPHSIPETDTTAPPSPRSYITWIFFSACSSTMLLATTNQITQNVAPMPLLWVLPLSVYLLSFAVCFRLSAKVSSDAWVPVTLAAQCFALYSMHLNSFIQIAAYTSALFAACMLSHKELYRTKPHPAHLGSFYLMIAIGGASGGIFVGVVAPLIFKSYSEFEFIYIIYSLIAICIMATQRRKWMRFGWLPLGIVALIIIILLHLNSMGEKRNCIWQSRNFYGTLRVIKQTSPAGTYNELVNGKIEHGIQYDSGPFKTLPTEYFHKGSGVGMAFNYHINRLAQHSLRVGIIGLGIGTLASYGQTNDHFRFYEINPDVIKLASDTNYFTYLGDCAAGLEIIPGDARITMERERTSGKTQAYDILVVDAFNSDAIPVHLLTREAFELYLYHTSENGIMAIHVSNLYLNLIPVVLSSAKHFNLEHAVIKISGDKIITQASVWVLLTRDRFLIDMPAIANIKAKEPGNISPSDMWTDDFSNLFSVLKKY